MIARVALLALLVACADDDPCDGAATCIRLDVQSATVSTIDQLELDLLYGAQHATVITQADGGQSIQLPLSTAVILDIDITPTTVGIVAAGKLGATVQGTGAVSTTIASGAQTRLRLELAPIDACTAGALYCGGDRLAGDPSTLYQCNAGGVPLARGRCPGACVTRPSKDDVCAATGGTCVDGGTYCGGDKLDGDPQVLYRCTAGAGTNPRLCTNGCIVNPGSDDRCR